MNAAFAPQYQSFMNLPLGDRPSVRLMLTLLRTVSVPQLNGPLIICSFSADGKAVNRARAMAAVAK